MVAPSLEDLQIQESVQRSGRFGLFNQFLAGLGPLSNTAQNFFNNQFDPFSGLFGLSLGQNPLAEDAGNVSGGGNFFNFLQNNAGVPPTAPGGVNAFNSGLGALRSANPFGVGTTGVADPVGQFFIDNPDQAENIIQSGFASQFNPLLRGAARNVAGRQVGNFLARDLSTPLFQAFLNDTIGFGNPNTFFSGFGNT